MTVLDLPTLLLLSCFISLTFAAALLLGASGLGEASAGVGEWVVADMVRALGRATLLIGLLPAATQTWAEWLGPWRQHSLSISLELLVMLWQRRALRRLSKQTVAPLGQALGLSLTLALGWLSLAYLVDDETLRVRLGFAIMSGVGLSTMSAALPISRNTWGGRLMLGVLVVNAGLLSSQCWQLSTLPLSTIFLINQIITILLSVGFLLLLQERMRERLLQLSITDALTGAYNRRGIRALLERDLANAQRYQRPLSLVVFDLDHFKHVNDRFGHAVGDAVLQGFVRLVQSMIRDGDAVGRWGGEEFLLVLPNQHATQAGEVAERIRLSFQNAPVSPQAPPVTVSAGVAQAPDTPSPAANVDLWIQQADIQLYEAKRRRNCVVTQLPGAPAPASTPVPAPTPNAQPEPA